MKHDKEGNNIVSSWAYYYKATNINRSLESPFETDSAAAIKYWDLLAKQSSVKWLEQMRADGTKIHPGRLCLTNAIQDCRTELAVGNLCKATTADQSDEKLATLLHPPTTHLSGI